MDVGDNFLCCLFYKSFKPKIWHSLSKQTAIPAGFDRIIIPSHSIKLPDPVSSMILLLFVVKLILIRIPSGKGLFVSIKAPQADTFLVLSSYTRFLFKEIVSIRAGSVSLYLSNRRLSFIVRTYNQKVNMFHSSSEVLDPVKFAPLIFYEEFKG